MECLYNSDFNSEIEIIEITGQEAKHAKALRIKIGDEILISNGKGLTAKCKLMEFDKSKSYFKAIEYYQLMGEPSVRLHAAIGILDNKDRFEFALEKSVELGIAEFTPLITRYSKSNISNFDRLIAKSISALKQCKRSILPIINSPRILNELLLNSSSKIILADEGGDSMVSISEEMLLLIGPEGGFSNEEINLIEHYNPQKLKLGNRRLRAETALIASITKIIL